jgi:hypothetical protein
VAKVLEAVGLMTPEEVARMVDEVSAGAEEASQEEKKD